MKGNEISVKELRADAVEWLTKLHQTMLVKEYGKGSVRNYCCLVDTAQLRNGGSPKIKSKKISHEKST
jgi:hypothetical protein